MVQVCHLSHQSVDQFVSLSVQKVYCGKMADWIHLPFGMVSGVSLRMGVLKGSGDQRREGAVFGVRNLLHSCAVVREPIELLFGVMTEVGRSTGGLEGNPCAPRERGSVGCFVLPLLWGHDRHFQANRTKYSNVHIMDTTAWIPTKFCAAERPPNMHRGWSSNVENKSKMADGRHLEKSKDHHVTVVV